MKFSPVNIEKRKEIDLRPGDVVRVHQKIEEKGKTRIQVFEGMVLARKHGTEPGATFTVRRTAGGFGVEKIFPLFSPMIDKIEIVKRSNIRRSKLYYIRRKAAKEISKRMKMIMTNFGYKEEEEKEEEAEAPVDADTTEESAEGAEEKVESENPGEETPTEEKSVKEEAPAEEPKEETPEETTKEEKTE